MKAMSRGIGLGAFVVLASCQQRLGDQPKIDPYEESRFFRDGRASREPVRGTVAWESRRDEAVASRTLPMPLTRELLERGQQRYQIYCAVCHGNTGNADGIVVQRGFPAPPSYHIERLRKAPLGHFFDVITNGFGQMYRYGDRIPPADRWAIAAYIRVLQLSRNVNVRDLTPEERERLKQ